MSQALLISAGLTAMVIGVLGATGTVSSPLLFIAAVLVFVLQSIVFYSIITKRGK